MYPLNPNPYTAASNIRGNATYRANGIAAGLPANFWVANPDVSHAYVVTNGPQTSYNGMQFVLNRRFSRRVAVRVELHLWQGRTRTTSTRSTRPYVDDRA